MSDEKRYYDALKVIAKGYLPVERITEKRAQQDGLGREEFIEYAYENMQQVAVRAIYGKRRPK